jgi:tetratricopeptide (TPR) repeat protein
MSLRPNLWHNHRVSAPPRVFINYRADDTSAVATILARELSRALSWGTVFLDHQLDGGEEWPPRLRAEVRAADVVLVLIGPRWLTLQGPDGIRRLDESEDWVRQEIETALAAHRVVVPVLVDGARPLHKRMFVTAPKIECLADLQATTLNTKHWDVTFKSLVILLTKYGFRAAFLSIPRQCPLPPADFTGREHELSRLRAKLQAVDSPFVGIFGMGGVGKSALAAKAIAELESYYSDGSIYLDLKGVSTHPLPVAEVLLHVIRAFEPGFEPHNSADLNTSYRAVLREKRAVLWFDNAADAEQLGPSIPPTGCALVVTSRRRCHIPGMLSVVLAPLEPKDACELLRRIAGDIPGAEAYFDPIARLCGYLPLAIRVSASALTEGHDPEHYTRRLANKTTMPLVEQSLGSSYTMLDSETAARFASLCVFPADFSVGAAAAIWQVEEGAAEDTLAKLVRHSLLELRRDTRRYWLHDLIALFTSGHIDEARRIVFLELYVRHFENVLRSAAVLYRKGGSDLQAGLALFDREWPNIRFAFLSASDQYSRGVHRFGSWCSALADAGTHLLGLRLGPTERIAWCQVGLGAARDIGDEQAARVHLINLGIAHRHLGRFNESIESFQEALSSAHAARDRHTEALAVGNLGISFNETGNYDSGEEFHTRQLEIGLELADRRVQCNAQVGITAAKFGKGDYANALSNGQHALVLARSIGHSRAESKALGLLGRAHGALQQHDEAIEAFAKQRSIARELGDKRIEAIADYDCSDIYARIGRLAEAIASMQACVQYEMAIGHPDAPQHTRELEDLQRNKLRTKGSSL